MNKKDYVAKKRELENIIRNGYTQLRELEKEYVATNQPYPIGTKLKVTFEDEFTPKPYSIYAIVRKYELCGDDVQPELAKINKNGSMHKTANYWVSWWKKPVLEVCND